MLKIYGVFRSRASRNIWLLNEIGMPFEHVPVIQANRLANPEAAGGMMHTRSPAFLAVNPNGQIPSMEDDGLRLHESLAINLYIASKYGAALGPADLAETAQMTNWTLWVATGVEPHAINILYNRVAKPEAERDPKLADAAEIALAAPFGVLEKALAATGHPVGARFTVADINLAEVFRYALAAPKLMDAHPNVKNWLAACHARPAFKAMMAGREAEPA